MIWSEVKEQKGRGIRSFDTVGHRPVSRVRDLRPEGVTLALQLKGLRAGLAAKVDHLSSRASWSQSVTLACWTIDLLRNPVLGYYAGNLGSG